jgi:hypothetical protein
MASDLTIHPTRASNSPAMERICDKTFQHGDDHDS